MTSDSGAAVPAAFNSNGSSPAARTADASEKTAAASEQAAVFLGQLPQAIGSMLAQVVRSIPAQHLCAQCIGARMAWEAAHGRDVETAVAAGRAAHGIPDGAPLPPSFDPAPFLPENLRPGAVNGMPPLSGAITTVSGTDYCAQHIPGRPSGRTLLVAQGSLTPSALASLGG